MTRSVSITSGVLTPAWTPVTGVSVNPNRNPLVEEGLSSAVPAKLFGGYYTVSGSLDCIYRDWVKTYLTQIVTIINTPTTLIPLTTKIEIYDDAKALGEIQGVLFNSIELPMQSKDFVRPKLSFIGQRMVVGSGSGTAPVYTDVVGIFYSSTVSISGTKMKTKNFTIKFDLGIDQDYFLLGSPYIYAYQLNSLCEISGSFTLTDKTDIALLESLVNDNNSAAAIPSDPLLITNKQDLGKAGAVEIIIGASNGTGALCTIGVAANHLVLTDGTVNVQGRQLVEKTINFRYVNDGSSDILTIS